MLYLLDKLDLELFEFSKGKEYMVFDMWETNEKRVNRWIENERIRSIFSRKEIINLFKTKYKIQMVQVDKIRLKRYDKIVVWTPSGKYYMLEIKSFYR